MSVVVSADEIKKELAGYSPDKSEEFHHESAQKADKQFDKALKDVVYKEVVLLNGGTASGKTEFLSTQLESKNYLILDATLSSEKGADIKLRKIVKAKKKPIVFSVIPDDLKRAFIAFLNRDRKFSDTHFYKTHSGSRKTLLWIAENCPEVEVNVVESSYDRNQNLQFKRIEFSSRKNMIDFLQSIQRTEDEILKEVQL